MVRRALISVSDKTGIVQFATELIELGVEIVSTGGTEKILKEAGLDVIGIEKITDFPECFDGRVKTLNPKVHGGILAVRDNENHIEQMKQLEVDFIDMVVVNLYPFKNTLLNPNSTHEDIIENIDIGGPTMLRSAAKNYKDVIVVTDVMDYDIIIDMLKNGGTSLEYRMKLAQKVFEHTASYDALINEYFVKKLDIKEYPNNLTLTYEKAQDLRYGENPHQSAVFYKEIMDIDGGISSAIQLHGKELSFNNINDANAALELLKEFEAPTVVALKHTNPCGVGTGIDIHEAYVRAYKADPISIFGGIVAANKTIDEQTAIEINKIFIEIVIAPDYDDDALEILKQKKNIRILKVDNILRKQSASKIDIKKVNGGILVQELNNKLINDEYEIVTERMPSKAEIQDLLFALKVVKHVKSNAIVFAKNKKTISIGVGQTNRIWSVKNCIENAVEDINGGVLASDAFFPFSDCVEMAAKAGIKAIIQPGGSIRDNESIEMANKYGIAMIFTGVRHFKH